MLGDFKRVNFFTSAMLSERAFASDTLRKEAPRQETHVSPTLPPMQKTRSEERALQSSIYIGGMRANRVFHALEMRCDKQRHFACLAFFVLSSFFELIAAFTAPINAGATDTATMPKTMTSKWSCTNGMPPKK